MPTRNPIPTADFVRAKLVSTDAYTHDYGEIYGYEGWAFARTSDGNTFAFEVLTGAPYPFEESNDGYADDPGAEGPDDP